MLTLRIRAVLCAAMALAFAGLLSGTARAATQYDYFEQYGYDDELRRCFEMLKPALGVQATDTVAWVVEEIERRGPWYRFEIRTTVIDRAGETQVDDFRAGCKANRWTADTRLLERPNEAAGLESGEQLARNP